MAKPTYPINRSQSTWERICFSVEGYETREDIAKLTQSEIGVLRSELPVLAENEYYWHALIGLRVFLEDGTLVGQVDGFLETRSNVVSF